MPQPRLTEEGLARRRQRRRESQQRRRAARSPDALEATRAAEAARRRNARERAKEGRLEEAPIQQRTLAGKNALWHATGTKDDAAPSSSSIINETTGDTGDRLHHEPGSASRCQVPHRRLTEEWLALRRKCMRESQQRRRASLPEATLAAEAASRRDARERAKEARLGEARNQQQTLASEDVLRHATGTNGDAAGAPSSSSMISETTGDTGDGLHHEPGSASRCQQMPHPRLAEERLARRRKCIRESQRRRRAALPPDVLEATRAAEAAYRRNVRKLAKEARLEEARIQQQTLAGKRHTTGTNGDAAPSSSSMINGTAGDTGDGLHHEPGSASRCQQMPHRRLTEEWLARRRKCMRESQRRRRAALPPDVLEATRAAEAARRRNARELAKEARLEEARIQQETLAREDALWHAKGTNGDAAGAPSGSSMISEMKGDTGDRLHHEPGSASRCQQMPHRRLTEEWLARRRKCVRESQQRRRDRLPEATRAANAASRRNARKLAKEARLEEARIQQETLAREDALWHATGTNGDAAGAPSGSSMISETTGDTGDRVHHEPGSASRCQQMPQPRLAEERLARRRKCIRESQRRRRAALSLVVQEATRAADAARRRNLRERAKEARLEEARIQQQTLDMVRRICSMCGSVFSTSEMRASPKSKIISAILLASLSHHDYIGVQCPRAAYAKWRLHKNYVCRQHFVQAAVFILAEMNMLNKSYARSVGVSHFITARPEDVPSHLVYFINGYMQEIDKEVVVSDRDVWQYLKSMLQLYYGTLLWMRETDAQRDGLLEEMGVAVADQSSSESMKNEQPDDLVAALKPCRGAAVELSCVICTEVRSKSEMRMSPNFKIIGAILMASLDGYGFIGVQSPKDFYFKRKKRTETGRYICHQHFVQAAQYILREMGALDKHYTEPIDASFNDQVRPEDVPLHVVQNINETMRNIDYRVVVNAEDVWLFLKGVLQCYYGTDMWSRNEDAELTGYPEVDAAEILESKAGAMGDINPEEADYVDMPEAYSLAEMLEFEAGGSAANDNPKEEVEYEDAPEGHNRSPPSSSEHAFDNSMAAEKHHETAALRTQPAHLRRSYLIEGSRLMQLFRFCPECGHELDRKQLTLTPIGTGAFVGFVCGYCPTPLMQCWLSEGQTDAVSAELIDDATVVSPR